MYAGKVSAVLFGSQERAVLVLYGAAEFKTKSQGRRSAACSGLYVPDQKSFLFEVSYYKKKINLEVFHCLTDGTGALNFLKELVRNYLMIRYPKVEFPPVSEEEISTASDHEEDSFSQYYSKSDHAV